MVKQKILYLFGGILIVVVAVSCGSNRLKLPPLNETFSFKDKNPFGAYVLHNELGQMFSMNSIREVKTNFDHTWRDISDTGSLYVSVSKNLFLSGADLESMLAYVYIGNSLFISSDHIDQKLLDTLGCEINYSYYGQHINEMKYTSVRLDAGIFNDSASYKYFYVPFYNHFLKMDTLHSRILGNNETGSNFMVVFHGRGRIYLHTEPRAFSNYFILQKNNYEYCRNAFSFTPSMPEHIYWDDYYNRKNYPQGESGNKSGLAVLLQYPAMAWAFWLLLTLFGLYILFGGKRRQRIIKTIPPNANTTLTFTETISRLYLQKKDNHNIAEKLITYFLEHIRNHYYLNTGQINDDFINTVSRKSNNSKEGAESLFKTISSIQRSTEISDQQLLLLNQQIEKFYKNKL